MNNDENPKIIVENILKDFNVLREKRRPWESLWEEMAQYVLPREAGFSENRGPNNLNKVFDSTAPLALERFAAVLESVLTPRFIKWHGLALNNNFHNKNTELNRYLELLNNILFDLRYRAEANFSNQISEAYLSLGVFGTAAIYIDEVPGKGFAYRHRHLSEMFFDENAYGQIDKVMRLYKLTALEALNVFGENNLPEQIVNIAEENNEQNRKFTFLHAILPNKNINLKRADYKGMPYSSCHILKDFKYLVRSSGYRVFPYAISRYQTAPGEIYGRSPALTVLADIKQVNEMEKTLMRAGQKAVDPPLLLSDDDILSAFSLKAGALNYGGLSEDGKQKVMPLQTGANLNLGFKMLEQKRQVINDAFLINLFQVLVSTPKMTATEVIERAGEKASLLGPVVGRQQAELLSPIIKRELDILLASGTLHEFPLEIKENLKNLAINYESPLNKHQKLNQAYSILGTLEEFLPLMKSKPELMEVFDWRNLIREVAQAKGVPSKIILTDEEIEAKRAEILKEGEEILKDNLGAQAETEINEQENTEKLINSLLEVKCINT